MVRLRQEVDPEMAQGLVKEQSENLKTRKANNLNK